MSDGQLSFRKSANIDRVTDKRKDSLFRLVDTDGSGSIDAQEFAVLYDAIKKDLAEELEKEAVLEKEASSARRRFKMLLLFVAVLVSFLAASVAANFAVIFTVVDEAITTTTTSSGLLGVKGSDIIAKTAVATQDVPLVAAPALDIETLSNVKSMKVSYHTGQNFVEAQLAVVGVRKHNETFVEFVTDVAGETVEVLNGVSSLVVYSSGAKGKQTRFNICSANVTCSAFSVGGIDAEATIDQARAALETHGFHESSRSLQGITLASCGAGSWLTAECTNGYSSSNHPGRYGTCGAYIAAWKILYHSGYTSTRHVVFILHGLWGHYLSMWDVYCVQGTDECPLLTNYYFRHLVFTFPGSGIYYGGSTAAWSTDTYDGITYYFGADALASLSCGVNPTLGWAWDGCSFNGQLPSFTTPSGGSLNVGSTSDIMIIGYSHGGGLATYSNYVYGYKDVTRSVAIDYHGYHNPSWIADTSLGTGAGLSNYATIIYYACASTWYDDSQIHGSGEKYTGTTTSATHTNLYGPATFTANGGYNTGATGTAHPAPVKFDTWAWSDASTGHFLKFHVHGLASLGGACNANEIPPSVHANILTYVDITAEICDWVGTCGISQNPSPSPPPPIISPSPPPSSPSPPPPSPVQPDCNKKGWCCPAKTRCMEGGYCEGGGPYPYWAVPIFTGKPCSLLKDDLRADRAEMSENDPRLRVMQRAMESGMSWYSTASSNAEKAYTTLRKNAPDMVNQAREKIFAIPRTIMATPPPGLKDFTEIIKGPLVTLQKLG